MTSCGPSYSHTTLPIDPVTCGAACQGVTFSVDSMTTSFSEEEGCKFQWQVTRKTPTGSVVFADEAVVPCPGSKVVTFYCDAAKNCPRFQLNLYCNADTGPPGA